MSSSVRPTRAAPTFSTTWATLEVPGIGKITGDRASSQANATCDGVTFFRAATRRRGLSSPQLAGRQRKPRDEDDVVLLAVFQRVLRAAESALRHQNPSISVSRRRLFDGSLERGQRAFERRARLIHNDLSQNRTFGSGEPFLLRAFNREQVEGVWLRQRVDASHVAMTNGAGGFTETPAAARGPQARAACARC
jgi:hypothetical protein